MKKTTQEFLLDYKKLFSEKTLALVERKEDFVEILKICKSKPKTKLNRKDVADFVFSIFIRITNADKNGFCTCCTCWRKIHWMEIQNGHFRTRGFLFFRFNKENCHPQCYYCNVQLHGNYRNYCLYMIHKYWPEKEKYYRTFKKLFSIKDYQYRAMILKRWDEITVNPLREKRNIL